ncbi:cytochrome c oxidase accessory protein CcoG [Marinicella gelatinilytica]|uniref:cytochrome c oxidase accessory protein CcoG n=1 Tax=Marinicella gelatinilytica TaxID=2996017 RepID=UPI002260B616|nr:cytochrome c oxidase accessory protein CcoG [Marinicella gelatinilytica]MCX7545833.1 cytochrome c oxidase accessory protein CcoG [Marinicella gelatinilytica]
MSTNETKPVELKLYKAHEKVYPRETKGRFQFKRKLAVFVLLGLFYFLPWLDWGGHQAVLFDLPARRFYIFGITLWPQDFIFLALMLIIAAFSLFFFTALAGRLWCGFACPQTVWTEVFIWMEQLTEGNRNKRMKLDKGPWNFNKIWRKTAKQAMWITFALWTGFTFVGFFTPIKELAVGVWTWNLGPWETFWMFFYGFATYGNAGFLREQVCLYMCPYARFQGAMFDKETLIISYDVARGEPRMRGKTRREAENPGDCIDCTMCVQVCPTGIDIRDGLQYECIACAACIDACDEVMETVGLPKGLIRYTTENSLAGKESRVFRPRIIIYGIILTLLLSAFGYALFSRSTIDANVIPDRNSFYRIVDAKRIENVYNLKIMNKGPVTAQYQVTATGLDGLKVDFETEDGLTAEPGELISVPIRIRADRAVANKKIHTIKVIVNEVDNPNNSSTETVKYFGYDK